MADAVEVKAPLCVALDKSLKKHVKGIQLTLGELGSVASDILEGFTVVEIPKKVEAAVASPSLVAPPPPPGAGK
jgi:hypothetical protein